MEETGRGKADQEVRMVVLGGRKDFYFSIIFQCSRWEAMERFLNRGMNGSQLKLLRQEVDGPPRVKQLEIHFLLTETPKQE